MPDRLPYPSKGITTVPNGFEQCQLHVVSLLAITFKSTFQSQKEHEILETPYTLFLMCHPSHQHLSSNDAPKSNPTMQKRNCHCIEP